MRVISFFVFILASSTAFGNGPTTGSCILFDLTFWQRALHLSRAQRSEISRINCDLHHTMFEVSMTHPDEEAIQILLGVWRYSMYDVLSVRQKKKWKKIVARYYGAEQSSACE